MQPPTEDRFRFRLSLTWPEIVEFLEGVKAAGALKIDDFRRSPSLWIVLPLRYLPMRTLRIQKARSTCFCVHGRPQKGPCPPEPQGIGQRR